MINNALNLNLYRQQLVQSTRVQIPSFLQEDAAEKLHQCLLHDVPWAGEPRLAITGWFLAN